MCGEQSKNLRLGRLKSAGIDAPWKVPLYMPTEYVDGRFPLTDFSNPAPTDVPVLASGTLFGEPTTEWKNGAPMTRWALADGSGNRLYFSFFGDARPIVDKLKKTNKPVWLFGKIQYFGVKPYLVQVEVADAALAGRVIARYPGKSGKLSSSNAARLMADLVPKTLSLCASRLRRILGDMLPARHIRRLLNCPRWTLEELLHQVHFPTDPDAGQAALSIIDRLAALLSAVELKQAAEMPLPERPSIRWDRDWHELAAAFPHPLTTEQRQGIETLIRKFQAPRASRTLINGDVGTGKSITYQVAVAYAVNAGARTAVLLPHNRLAEQAYREIRSLWPELPVQLVSGSADGPPDEDLPNLPLLVGTTALLHRPVGRFDVVVVDEQQRYSVDQRQALSKSDAHLIEVSATPIPRTMAYALYGAMDVIPITHRHTPQNIRSAIVMNEGVQAMLTQVRSLVDDGHRILVVCPKRRGDDDEALSSVSRVASRWESLFPGRVRRAESSMDDADIAEAIDDVIRGQAQILVATTVVETGLNIPQLRGVIVTNGDRFGVSQLHQIRGRLAREGGDGWFWIYLPKPVGTKTMARLEAVVSTCDGFELSQLDMSIRGTGDLSAQGLRQHGSADTLIYNRPVPTTLLDEMLENLATLPLHDGSSPAPQRVSLSCALHT